MTNAIIDTKLKLFRPGGQDSPIELVLGMLTHHGAMISFMPLAGILPSGASYLLMSGEQMQQFTQKHRLAPPRNPWRASNFLSLSPIYFSSYDELAAKIATYKQRPRNKNRREHEVIEDNSQANRGYVKTGSGVVHYRAYFEHQRCVASRGPCTAHIDARRPGHCTDSSRGISSQPRSGSLCRLG